MKTQVNKLEANAMATKRWRTRLKRAMTMLDKLERQRKRLEAAPKVPSAKAAPSVPEKSMPWCERCGSYHYRTTPHIEPIVNEVIEDLSKPAPPPPSLDTAIPDFLKRGIAAQKAVDDIIAAEQIKAEQAEAKKQKTAGRIAKMKAVKSGDTKKMPLTGKAALEMIRNG